ncbi:LuxR C-terminal-related transcriptional regulator [Kitasatospora sp. NBC_00458]|uniref:LuxR C-terminal-related transcriptional regulator n=1 Tax=Kitasatospora sp. NBC_00458 TaxID=2903568 RepID=UPI002E18B80A
MAEHDIRLPGEAARELYLTILREGGRLRIADVREEDADGVRQLVDTGLLHLRVADGIYSAVNPRAVGERIGAELRNESTRLLARAAAVPDLLDDLTQAYDAAPRRYDLVGGVRRIAGMEQIRHLVSQLIEDHPRESWAAQPGGARPREHMRDALEHTRRFAARGGVIRTIYEPAARQDQATAEYAARSTELGCPVRVLAVPFDRVLIFDRTVALIPAAPDNTVAALVEDPAVVAFLVNAYEQHWQQAEGVNWAALAAGTADPAAVHEQVGRLLAQGLTQRTVASRLGLSERTVAGHIARLRELHDAETLFQLGWQMRGARDA